MSPQEQLFRSGDRCGPYEINSFLARGGMGEVYLGTHVFNGRKAAIKVLQLSHTGDARAMARIRQEATFLCRLNHPNIVTTYDSNIAEDGTIWIAMERLQGESLREIVTRHGRVPASITLGMVSDVTRGVAAAHELDAIHRDLKPENIYVTSDGRVKVLDFGIAKFGSYELKNTDPGRGPVGTPFYMSPEQIQGLRVDPRSDVYSLGLVLYELLAGHHPFLPQGPYERLPDFRELTAWHLQREPIALSKILPGLPEAIYDIVETALRKDPDERFANMDDFGRALRAARRQVIALDPSAPARWIARPEDEHSGALGERGEDDAIDRPVRKGSRQSPLAMQATVLRPEPVLVTTVPTPLAPPERRRIVADTIKDSVVKEVARGFGASWKAFFRRSAAGDAPISSGLGEKSPYLTRRFWVVVGGLGTALGAPAGILLAVLIHVRGGHLGGLHRERKAGAPAMVRAVTPPSGPTLAAAPPPIVETWSTAVPSLAAATVPTAVTRPQMTGAPPEPAKAPAVRRGAKAARTSPLVEPDWSPESLENHATAVPSRTTGVNVTSEQRGAAGASGFEP